MAKQDPSLFHDAGCWFKALISNAKDYLITALIYSALFGAIGFILFKLFEWFWFSLIELLKR